MESLTCWWAITPIRAVTPPSFARLSLIHILGVDQKGAIEPAVLEKTKATIRRLGLDALIVVGGDGSQ